MKTIKCIAATCFFMKSCFVYRRRDVRNSWRSSFTSSAVSNSRQAFFNSLTCFSRSWNPTESHASPISSASDGLFLLLCFSYLVRASTSPSRRNSKSLARIVERILRSSNKTSDLSFKPRRLDCWHALVKWMCHRCLLRGYFYSEIFTTKRQRRDRYANSPKENK